MGVMGGNDRVNLSLKVYSVFMKFDLIDIKY